MVGERTRRCRDHWFRGRYRDGHEADCLPSIDVAGEDSACYNEAFYEAQFVRDFLARTSDILFAELGVDMLGVGKM